MEDAEADAVWEAVDAKLSAHVPSVGKTASSERGKIHEQFADLRRDLSSVSVEGWESIPEVGSFTAQPKRGGGAAASMPLPDSVIKLQLGDSLRGGNGMESSIAAGGSGSAGGGGNGNGLTDLKKLGEARVSAVSARLDVNASSEKNIDPQEYLAALESHTIQAAAQVADEKKLRGLLASLRETYSAHAPSWIAAARLEESAGKLRSAREIALEGCLEAPDSEDMWLEAARLCPPEQGKRVLARAASHLPSSINVWMAAADLEHSGPAKSAVFRKALVSNPRSALLWKAAIQLEKPERAAILLEEAVKCVPDDVDLWLALAKLQPYEEAKASLNSALAHVGLNSLKRVWISAAKLEESRVSEVGGPSRVPVEDFPHSNVTHIVGAGLRALEGAGLDVSFGSWEGDLVSLERLGFVMTAQAFGLALLDVRALSVEDLMERAHGVKKSGMVRVASAVLATGREMYPDSVQLWATSAQVADGPETKLDVLEAGVVAIPSAPILWLMLAKTAWKCGDMGSARSILVRARSALPDSEPILLASAKLEVLAANDPAAWDLLSHAMEHAPSARVLVRSAVFARRTGEVGSAHSILDRGLEEYPGESKLWMMKGQLLSRLENDMQGALEVYKRGLSTLPKCVPLWILSAQTRLDMGQVVAARAVLERARAAVPESDHVLEAAAKLELLSENKEAASVIVADGLVAHPRSGRLWVLAIELEPAAKKRSKAMDAVKAAKNEPRILTFVARLFAFLGVVGKARAWLKRSISIAPEYGDAWGWAHLLAESDEEKGRLEREVDLAEPRYGDEWVMVSKDDGNAQLTHAAMLLLLSARLGEKRGREAAAGVISDRDLWARL